MDSCPNYKAFSFCTELKRGDSDGLLPRYHPPKVKHPCITTTLPEAERAKGPNPYGQKMNEDILNKMS